MVKRRRIHLAFLFAGFGHKNFGEHTIPFDWIEFVFWIIPDKQAKGS